MTRPKTRTIILIVAAVAVLYYLSLAFCSQNTDSNAMTRNTSLTKTQPPTTVEADA